MSKISLSKKAEKEVIAKRKTTTAQLPDYRKKKSKDRLKKCLNLKNICCNYYKK